jgi:phage FluMu protein Com
MEKVQDINCLECGKLLAKKRNGKIYVWCKSCKKEIELIIEIDDSSLESDIKAGE